MKREYHKWHSERLNRDMELLEFGHAGARVIIFPTSQGRFFDWEDRGMIDTLSHHIEKGWLHVFCVDSVDSESWFNGHVHPHDRAERHLTYQRYITEEVLPFTRSLNDNPFVIACGASFGAYHSMSVALRYPQCFNRVVAMSGVYDIGEWTGGHFDRSIHEGSPVHYVCNPFEDEEHFAKVRELDIIFATGQDDSAFEQSKILSNGLWERGVWHAFRVWDGWAHDWPEWKEMVLHYIGGPDSRGGEMCEPARTDMHLPC